MSRSLTRALVAAGAAVAMTLAASAGSASASPAPRATAQPVPEGMVSQPTSTPAPPELAEPPAGGAPEPPPRLDGRVPVDPVAPPSPRPDGRVPIDPADPPPAARPDDRVPIDPPAAPPPADGAGEPAAPPDPALPPDAALPPEAPPAVPAAEAPTDSLRRLAESMDVASNSLTVQITFPPMPGITPTEISIGFSGPRTTQNYHPQFGFRYAYSYPLTDAGATQRAHFSVTLTEKVPGGQRFAIDTHRDLVPLFDITLSKLILSQTGDCDLPAWLGNIADPWVVWFDPLGGQHEDRGPIYLGDNRHEIRGFDRTFSGLHLAQGHRLPYIEWTETDVSAPGVPFDPPFVFDATPPLLPGTTRTIREVKAEEGDTGFDYGFSSDCEGLFTYDITYTPVTWASLNPNLRTPR